MDKKILALGALLVIGIGAKKAVNSVLDKIVWSLGRYDLDYDALKVKISVPFSIENQNTLGSLTIDEINGSVYYGEEEIGTVRITVPLVLLPSEVAETNLVFETTLLELGSDVYTLITEGQYLGILTFDGALVTNLGTLPVNQPIKVV